MRWRMHSSKWRIHVRVLSPLAEYCKYIYNGISSTFRAPYLSVTVYSNFSIWRSFKKPLTVLDFDNGIRITSTPAFPRLVNHMDSDKCSFFIVLLQHVFYELVLKETQMLCENQESIGRRKSIPLNLRQKYL